MRRVHVDRAMIVGNSSGGGLALDFVLAHPEMVEALFLIGPVVHGMPSTDYFNERGSQNTVPLAHGDVKGTAENWSRDRFLIAGDDQRARKKVDDVLTENPQNLRVAGELEIRPSPPAVLRLSSARGLPHSCAFSANSWERITSLSLSISNTLQVASSQG